MIQASHQQIGNDLYWHCFVKSPEMEELSWFGYNDSYWWNEVSKAEHINTRKAKDGKAYKIDFRTNTVTEVI